MNEPIIHQIILGKHTLISKKLPIQKNEAAAIVTTKIFLYLKDLSLNIKSKYNNTGQNAMYSISSIGTYRFNTIEIIIKTIIAVTLFIILTIAIFFLF